MAPSHHSTGQGPYSKQQQQQAPLPHAQFPVIAPYEPSRLPPPQQTLAQPHDARGDVQGWPQPGSDQARSGHYQQSPLTLTRISQDYAMSSGAVPYKKRRPLRAQQACDECRKRKQKCSEEQPCETCEEYKIVCVYRDPPLTGKDQDMKTVLNLLKTQGQTLDELQTKVDGFMERHWRAGQVSAAQDLEMRDERTAVLGKHRTAPHKLFGSWSSVQSLLSDAGICVNDGYVTAVEDRSTLRLFSDGEASDEPVGMPSGALGSPFARRPSHQVTPALSPFSDGNWSGAGLSGLPDDDKGMDFSSSPSGRGSTGDLDLDTSTIRSLHASYLRNIHIMHPILDESILRKTMEAFCTGYGTEPTRDTFAVPIAALDADDRPEQLPQFRDSSAIPTMTAAGTNMRRERGTRVQPSLGNAMFLLVLALGRICLHTDPLRGVTPGLAYYTQATRMIGDHLDGNDLIHAQIFILAGLFKGQLARVRESMSWYQMAGRVVLDLLDHYQLYKGSQSDDHGHVPIKNPRHILIVIAAWSCLQLETDILADIPLPPSGIQEKEPELLPVEMLPQEEGISMVRPGGAGGIDETFVYFVAQLFLRRRLNRVHVEIYGSASLNLPLKAVQEILLGHDAILTQWRHALPAPLQWEDGDPPATDILAARLRGKYYGARYVTNRPFLDYALHIMPHVIHNRANIEEAAVNAAGNPRDVADVRLFKAIQRMGDAAIWEGVQQCVRAAMHSTVAFDGIADRLIVTNIHGTAHAQFGNMLVLSATFHDPRLRSLVPADELQALLVRTIRFLRKLATISPTCGADCLILEKLEKTLFPPSVTPSPVANCVLTSAKA